MTTSPLYLGKTYTGPPEDVRLDIVPLEADGTRDVTFETDEFQAICPVTNQPDIYKLTITLVGVTGHTIESKSLKMWLGLFRDRGIFAEDIPVVIAAAIEEAFEQSDATLTTVFVAATQNVRGGITTTVTVGSMFK